MKKVDGHKKALLSMQLEAAGLAEETFEIMTVLRKK
jgi:hypothetical protein